MGARGGHIPDPGFAGDAGDADKALAHALQAHAGGDGSQEQVLGAMVTARLLVPVVAVMAEEEPARSGALRQEKSTDMALVTLVGGDGRRALPVFTSLAELTRWRPDARPVPVEASRAAVAAAAEGASALIVDVAGPHRFEVSGAALEALGRGRGWVPPYADPDVHDAVAAAVAGEPSIATAEVGAGEAGSVRVTLVHVAGVDLAEVTAAAGAVATRLATDAIIRDRARHGLDLVVMPPR